MKSSSANDTLESGGHRLTLEGLDFGFPEFGVGAVDVRGYDTSLEAAGLREVGHFLVELYAGGGGTSLEGVDAE